jgi:hypothetical protein
VIRYYKRRIRIIEVFIADYGKKTYIETWNNALKMEAFKKTNIHIKYSYSRCLISVT